MPVKNDFFRGGENSTSKQIPIHSRPLPAPLGVHLENLVFFDRRVAMMIRIQLRLVIAIANIDCLLVMLATCHSVFSQPREVSSVVYPYFPD